MAFDGRPYRDGYRGGQHRRLLAAVELATQRWCGERSKRAARARPVVYGGVQWRAMAYDGV